MGGNGGENGAEDAGIFVFFFVLNSNISIKEQANM